jgi:hypothetical protein
MANTICLVSTGAEVTKRAYYTTNDLATYKIQNHVFFSAKVDQFSSRSDVHRRTLTFAMRPAVLEETGSKKKLMKDIHEARTRIWAEIILRLQNIIRAHQQFGDKHYRCQSEMTDYENYTLCCAEQEGTLEETRNSWEATRKLYREAITDSNPLVYALRTWVGQSPNARGDDSRCPNADRVVSPQTLHGEMDALFFGTRSFPFKSPAAFGKHIGNNLSALKVVGFERVPARSGWNYVCRPSEDEIERCLQQYTDFSRAAGDHARLALGGGQYHAMDINDDMDGGGHPPPYRN